MITTEQMLVIWARHQIGLPFIWGSTDCAMVAVSAIDIITGGAHRQTYGGQWSTEAEAMAAYDRLPHLSALLAELGAEVLPGHLFAVGDLITVPTPTWPEQYHVVLGRRSLCCDIEHGVVQIPTRPILAQPGARLWRLPCRKPSL